MAFSTTPSAFLRALCILASFFCLVTARGKLPRDFQVDLIFPQPNKTYAPTPWFPVVFGIQNAQKLWPLPFSLTTRVVDVSNPRNESQDWQVVEDSFSESDIGAAIQNTTGDLYFHIITVNTTNASTSTWYLEWFYDFANRCLDKNFMKEQETAKEMTDAVPAWATLDEEIWIANIYHHWIRHPINFHLAPGGEFPDIEAAAKQCQNYEDMSTEAVRITDVITRRGICPFFETDVPGTNCNYRPIAKEVAANASALLLGAMGCKEGDWRNITAPCNHAIGSSAQNKALGILVPVTLAFILGW